MKDLVSIIMPCYNHELFIKDAIFSVIDQTYENIELIVINDGSIDSTLQKIIELEYLCKSRFRSFLLINQSNQGVGKSLNNGILQSNGEYIGTLASDDMYYKTYIEDIINEFSKLDNTFGMVSGDASFINAIGKKLFFNDRSKIVTDPSHGSFSTLKELTFDYDKTDFVSNYGSYKNVLSGKCGFTQATVFRRAVLIDVGMYNEKNRVEDVDLCLKISKKYKSKYLDKPLYKYRIHGENSVLKNTSFLSQEIVRILSNERNYCIKNELELEWRTRVFLELNTILRSGRYQFILIFLLREGLVLSYLLQVLSKLYLLSIAKISMNH